MNVHVGRNQAIRALALSLLCTISGCGVLFTSGKPGTLNSAKTDYAYTEKETTAVTYYLPKDVFEVTAQIEEQVKTNIVYPKNDEDKPPVVEKAKPALKLAGFDLATITVADRLRPFLIDANSPGFYKNDSTINVSEAGLLESVNAKTAGAGGAVVQNVLKLAGTVLPFISGVPSIPPVPVSKKSVESVAYESAEEGARNLRMFLNQQDELKSVAPPPAAQDSCGDDWSSDDMDDEASADVKVRAFTRQYFGDRIELRYAFRKMPDRRRLKQDFCDTLGTLRTRKAQLEKTTTDLASETNTSRFRPMTLKLQTQRLEMDRAAAAHQAARDAMNAAAAAQLVDDGVGTVKKTSTRKFLLDLENIPVTADVDKLASLGERPLAEVGALVEANGLKRAKELFTDTRTIISLGDVQPLDDNVLQAKKWAENKYDTCSKSLTRSAACIYYREPILQVLKVWPVKTRKDDQGKEFAELQPPEDRLLLLVGAKSPIRAIDLPTNAWTKRDTAVTFNARGRLITLQRNAGSAAEDMTAALQQGFRSGVTEYETSLKSIKTIGETRQAIALQPLADQIAVAQKQLELIKAQASLGAASSSSQVLLDTELANIEKNLVTAQQQLVAAQNQLAKDTATGASFAEINALTEANTLLTAQIQQLKNEIDLIKLRKQLQELQSTSPE